MGEYYTWVNIDRKEYIRPSDFNYGSKRHESCSRDGEVLRALRDLLSKEWKECRVFWMGDGCSLPEKSDSELFSIMKVHCNVSGSGNRMIDTVYEDYKNMSGLFKCAEEQVREEIEFYMEGIRCGKKDLVNEYGIDVLNPYEGLFRREGSDFGFIVNKTRKIGYSFGITKICFKNGDETDVIDPLPTLLGYGNYYEPGEWIGDLIEVTDELPEGIKLLDSISLEW